jgi:hypothetical protein
MGLHGAASGPTIWSKISQANVTFGANANISISDNNFAIKTFSDQQRANGTLPPGFRHFLREPAAGERFTLLGRPYEPSNQHADAQRLMGKLAKRLEREPALPSLDNPDIPSGYTYFLQLVAHDFVHSSAFLSLVDGNLAALANTRASVLRLETIYGNGPASRPELYEPVAGGSGVFHPQLRIGPLRRNGPVNAANPAPVPQTIPDPNDPAKTLVLAFDLARGRCPFDQTARKDGLPEPMVGDARNDDHPILSQLVVLFHQVHNFILQTLTRAAAGGVNPIINSALSFDADYTNYLCARSATILIYRNIIRRDLLKRLLHPAVFDAYNNNPDFIADQRFVPGERWRAPLELTHGVMRVAHTMIRPDYLFNRTANRSEFTFSRMLKQSSNDSPTQMPLQHFWAVDWPQFFGPDAVNKSLKLRPHYEFHVFDPQVFPAPTAEGVPGLAYRDLLSGIDDKPWSVGSLVDALREMPRFAALFDKQSHLLARDPANPGVRAWQAPLAAWLRAVPAFNANDAFTDAEIEMLAADPPIEFFAAFEAMYERRPGTPETAPPGADGGRRLGVFSSVLMADVFFNILRRDNILKPDRNPLLPFDPMMEKDLTLSLREQLAQLSQLIFNSNTRLDFVPEIASFDDLLAAMKDHMPQVF